MDTSNAYSELIKPVWAQAAWLRIHFSNFHIIDIDAHVEGTD